MILFHEYNYSYVNTKMFYILLFVFEFKIMNKLHTEYINKYQLKFYNTNICNELFCKHLQLFII